MVWLTVSSQIMLPAHLHRFTIDFNAVQKLVEEGKVKYLGISEATPEEIRKYAFPFLSLLVVHCLPPHAFLNMICGMQHCELLSGT